MDVPPGFFYVTPLGVGLGDGHAQNKASVQLGVRQVKVPATVQGIHQPLIEVIASFQAEADEIERRRDNEFKTMVLSYPFRKFLSEPHVLANVELQAFDPVVAKHKPQLERAETTSEGHMPVAVVDDSTRFRGFVAEILGQHAQGFDQNLAIGDVETIAIEIGEHPLMRIEAVAVGVFESILEVAELGAKGSRAGHRGIDVEP